LDEIAKSKVVDMPALVSNNLLQQYDYFVIYFIQITFVSMGLQLIDISHFVTKWMVEKCFNRKDYNERLEFVDDYPFYLGYYCAYMMSVFCIAFLFSALVPWVTIAVIPFFLIASFFYKFNLTFFYKKEFKGR
jgi:hypothetical protein